MKIEIYDGQPEWMKVQYLQHAVEAMETKQSEIIARQQALYEYITKTIAGDKPEYPCGYDERPEDCGGQCAPRSMGGDCPAMGTRQEMNELTRWHCDRLRERELAFGKLKAAFEKQ